MNKILSIIICFGIFIGSSVSAAESIPFKKLTQPVSCSFFGQPLQVVSVEPTGKEFFNTQTQKYVYGYEVTVRRPSKDDGRGVAYDGLNYRLYYWAAEDQYSPSIAIQNGMKVYQDTHKSNDRFITLFITTGLQPGVHRIRIAIFPYLMYSDTSSFRDAITIYRHDYVSVVKRLVKSSSVPGFAAGVAWDKGESVLIDSALLWSSTQFGQIIEFEVPAIMPKITTRYARDANKQLKQNSLVPNPDFRNFIKTKDKRFHKRVAKQQYKHRDRLHANSLVAYKLYEYPNKNVGGKEICGDGIDNNNNKQIDENCYDIEMLVDDNQCRDDTIGVRIDNRNFGNTPAGHKREYDLTRLKRNSYHYLDIIAVNSAGKSMGCKDSDEVSWKVTLGKGMKFYSGGRVKSGILHANGSGSKRVKRFSFYIP